MFKKNRTYHETFSKDSRIPIFRKIKCNFNVNENKIKISSSNDLNGSTFFFFITLNRGFYLIGLNLITFKISDECVV